MSTQPAAWNIQWFFSTCALSPFARVEVQKKEKYGGKKEGETESMRAKAERAAGRSAWASQKPTGRCRERERESKRLKTQLTLFQATPLSNSRAQPSSHWPADSMHHNPMHGSSANPGLPCNSAFWISFSPWQHKPALGPGCGLCSVQHAHTAMLTGAWWAHSKAISLAWKKKWYKQTSKADKLA